MMFGKSSMLVAAVLSVVFAATTVRVEGQGLVMGSGSLCIDDLMCPGTSVCLGCPKRTEDSGSTGDCEFTLPEDSADTGTSKDGKSKGKDGKSKKSRRRRLKSSEGDDDDDDSGNGGTDGTTTDPTFNANCCDCNCIKRSEEDSCTCICYGFIDPTDSSTTGGSSKDGKGKDGKSKKSRRRRRHLQSDDEEDLTLHEEESHVRSRLAKRTEMDAGATEGGWHSWLVNSLWGNEGEDEVVDDVDTSDRRNLKKKKKKSKAKSKSKSASDDGGSGGDSGSDNGGQDSGEDGGGEDCAAPPTQCFYIKRDPGSASAPGFSQQCETNTFGRCATAADMFSLG